LCWFIYGAEWVESHALHVTLLHAPDFLGYDDAARMAKDHPELVERGLRIKKAGNALLRLLGGREIHPVNVRVGGFYRVPSRGELSAQRQALERARDDAAAMARWAMGLPFPDFERDYEFVALAHPAEYPFNEGRIASSAGLDIDAADFDAEFEERQEPRSTALHCRLRARGAYLVGPMARYRLNRERLSPLAKDLARAAGLGPVCRNPFRSIVVRAVEIVHALEEALRLIAAYEPPDAPFVEVAPRAGVGCAATEAPRGILYHAYRLDEAGRILEARIVPPTSQNQTTIEDDLRALLPAVLSEPPETIERRSEQAVRNHDPCISCAAHFLKLEIEGR
jgi:coenzyme F420-reducing hydrogenase alpha subunit